MVIRILNNERVGGICWENKYGRRWILYFTTTNYAVCVRRVTVVQFGKPHACCKHHTWVWCTPELTWQNYKRIYVRGYNAGNCIFLHFPLLPGVFGRNFVLLALQFYERTGLGSSSVRCPREDPQSHVMDKAHFPPAAPQAYCSSRALPTRGQSPRQSYTI